mmetsp:Transcript_37139/g.116877  ORF Transcript_37139/g.116877 Transcript_37139/m.116877 type:complete len:206 (+) Transcript_37139:1198-1815(+)
MDVSVPAEIEVSSGRSPLDALVQRRDDLGVQLLRDEVRGIIVIHVHALVFWLFARIVLRHQVDQGVDPRYYIAAAREEPLEDIIHRGNRIGAAPPVASHVGLEGGEQGPRRDLMQVNLRLVHRAQGVGENTLAKECILYKLCVGGREKELGAGDIIGAHFVAGGAGVAIQSAVHERGKSLAASAHGAVHEEHLQVLMHSDILCSA